jgi:hypothetical protein
MSEYNPDKWVIIKPKEKEEFKVLGSWSGSYLYGSSWRLSSGIVGIEEDGDFYIIKNHSGSTYKCHKKGNGMNIVASSIFSSIEDKAEIVDIEKIIDKF